VSGPAGAGFRVVVIGGGLAGLAAALACADQGARVTLLERRHRLGGLTWSFRHGDRWIDNGQHVFLRCCDQYLSFLERIGARSEVELPDRLDLPVAAPASRPGGPPRIGRLRRSALLPAPLHLAGSLLHYPHLRLADRLAAGRAMMALRRLSLEDPALDQESFGAWLVRHGQSPASVTALWDLITVPTVNLPASEASLAMAAKVFQTGLLRDARAGDIGWSRVPLGQLHGDRAAVALDRAGVDVRLGVPARTIEPGRTIEPDRTMEPGGSIEPGRSRFTVTTDDGPLDADAVIVAVPHEVAGSLLPPDVVAHQSRLTELGNSAVIDIHLVFDRRVTDWPLLAGLGSPVLWVFDRTSSSEQPPALAGSQYVAVSMSAADELLGRRPEDLVAWVTGRLGRLLPETNKARLIDSIVTKERNATFRAQPGTAALRPGPATYHPGLAVAGAWTDTGWPATMEGAVRSGRAAADTALAGGRPRRCATTTDPDPAPALAVARSLQSTDTEEVA
jgi:squalene-associated FAD-dependent desaturase